MPHIIITITSMLMRIIITIITMMNTHIIQLAVSVR